MSAPTLPFPQSLAEKYRPETSPILSDWTNLSAFSASLPRSHIRPLGYLLGPSGVGKTSMAQALCAEIKGELTHIPSQKCTAQAIEEACYHCHFVPLTGGFHVVLIDEADRMTPAAQLALLSKLDATAFPPNTVFIITCNSTDGLEPRFLSAMPGD